MADKVQQAATTLLRANGFYTVKTQDALVWGNNRGPGVKVPDEPGRADVVVMRDGNAVFVEVKTIEDSVWDSQQWTERQRAWTSMMAMDFGLDTYILLVYIARSASRADVRCNFLEDYLEKTPRLAWLIPAYELDGWLAQFEAMHGVHSIPYHSAMSGRISVREEHDGLLERFGHWGLDNEDYLAYGSNFALRWQTGYFLIPADHWFRAEFT